MGISNKTRAKHLVKANEVLSGAGQPGAQTILLGHKKFAFTPASVAILVCSLVIFIGVLVVLKVIIFGGVFFGAAIGGFMQTSKPNRGVGITGHGFVLFSRSPWTGKPSKIIGMDRAMPLIGPKEAMLCGETVVFADSEIQHGRLQPQQFGQQPQQQFPQQPQQSAPQPQQFQQPQQQFGQPQQFGQQPQQQFSQQPQQAAPQPQQFGQPPQ